MSTGTMGESSTAASRVPLATLPLYRFVDPSSSALFASPSSIPSKRAPPTPEAERVSKSARLVTPKVKAVLDRDELGMGKSPARRLFSDEPRVSPGISGAAAPTSPIVRRLAPSPPIHSSPSAGAGPSHRSSSHLSIHSSPSIRARDDFEDADPHDPGFAVYYDSHIGLGTPTSRRTLSEPLPLHLPSPASSTDSSTPGDRYENQENIPPPAATPSSTRSKLFSSAKSSPAAHISSDASSRSSSRSGASWLDEDDHTLIGVSGVVGVIVAESSPMTAGRKRTGKSKLAQVIDRDASSEPSEGGEDMEMEELTPGRTLRDSKGKGKEKLVLEVEG